MLVGVVTNPKSWCPDHTRCGRHRRMTRPSCWQRLRRGDLCEFLGGMHSAGKHSVCEDFEVCKVGCFTAAGEAAVACQEPDLLPKLFVHGSMRWPLGAVSSCRQNTSFLPLATLIVRAFGSVEVHICRLPDRKSSTVL